MKKVLAGLGYALLFALLGAGLTALAASLAAPRHALPLTALAPLAVFGAAGGLALWVLALCFARLPGARPPPGQARGFGLWQGVWGMAGFGIAMFAGGLLAVCLAAIPAVLHHMALAALFTAPDFLVAAVVAGELTPALWLSWYLRRQGPARLHDGSASGIGWRPAPRRAYAEAALIALALIALVAALFRVFPPNEAALDNLPMAKLFSGSQISLLAMLAVALLLGPMLEELAFRGIGFAGLAMRLGPLWASALTSLVFVAAHAQEKLHYPPGFIDVGLMALASCWLRLRHHSIRPGITLHILYNTGGLLVAALLPP